MKIHDLDPSSLSSLSYRIRICSYGGKWNPAALLLEFSGSYGHGSGGYDDADFIAASKAAALEILDVHAVVFDFGGMSYEWGNRLWNAVRCYRPQCEDMFPTAMVVSEKCRPGFSTCAGMVPPMFDSLEEALRFLEGPVRAAVDELMSDGE